MSETAGMGMMFNVLLGGHAAGQGNNALYKCLKKIQQENGNNIREVKK